MPFLPLLSSVLAFASLLFCGSVWGEGARAWDLSVGIGVAALPRYSGAAATSPRLRVWADAEYRTQSLGSLALDSGSLTIDPELRWNVVDRPDMGFGPLLGYRFGRTDQNPRFTSSTDGSSRLEGLPDVGSSFDAGLQGHLSMLGVPAFAQVRSALRGTQGTLLNIGLYLPLLPEQTFSLTVLPTATWADAKQMRALYGVSSDASSASGFPAYSPSGGWASAAVEVVGEWHVSRAGRIVANFAWERLLDGAASSPLVQSKNQLSVLGGVTWSF